MADLNVTIQDGGLSISIGGADQLAPLLDAANAAVESSEGFAQAAADTAAGVEDTLAALNVAFSPDETDFALATVDSEDNVAFGVRKSSGETFATLSDDSHVPIDVVTGLSARIIPEGLAFAEAPVEADWVLAVVDDAGNAMGFRGNGSIAGTITGIGSTDPDGNVIPLLPNWDIICIGDSMFGGAFGDPVTSLAAAFPDRNVINFGWGGRTSTQVAARFGAVETTLTVTGNQIPASGSAAAVPSIAILSSNATSGTTTMTGTVAGMACALTVTHGATDADDTYAIASSTGSAIACPAGTPFVPDNLALYQEHTALIWLGRNNPTEIETVRDDIVAIIKALTPRFKHVLVCSVLSPAGYGKTSPDPAAATYNQFMDLNNEIQRSVGADNFVDVREWMINRALIEAGITPTSSDIAQMADDAIPASASGDGTHPVQIVNDQIGPFLARNIIARGF
jgi:hypothetical protein